MTNQHQSFITEYLRHRSPFTAYCLAYNLKDCSNYESIMSSANRLMNNEEVGGTIRSILDNIRHEVEQEVRAEMKQEVLTIQRKRELLASIATGEMVAVQLYKGKDCNVCTQMVRPTINQMLRAIDLDNKMVGLYPVYNRQSKKDNISQQNTTNLENSLLGVSPEAFREGAAGGGCLLAQDNPEKNTSIGNNGAALNETNKNYHERINSQQSEIENTENHNKTQQTPEKNTQNQNTRPATGGKSQQSHCDETATPELPNRPIINPLTIKPLFLSSNNKA